MDSESRRQNQAGLAGSGKVRIMVMFTAIHFLVDLTCIFMMTAFLIPELPDRTAWLWCVILYNFFAFAFQLPVGAAADRIGKPAAVSAFGCLLIAVSFLLIRMPAAAAVTAGLGNACFHIGGGISVLKISEKRAALSGIYVSTGALGVYLAPKLAVVRSAAFMGVPFYLCAAFIMVILMLICAAAFAAETARSAKEETSRVLNNKNGSGETVVRICDSASRSEPRFFLFVFVVFSLTFTVCIRSYVGTILNFGWKSSGSLGFLFVLGIVFGKMAGGIVGDRLGWLKTSAASLLISAVMFIFAPSVPVCGILGVFLFNMTMPVPLTALVNIYPQDQGLAFGITTLALFIGIIPSMFGAADTLIFSFKIWLTICVFASAAFLAAGLKGYKYLQNDIKNGERDLAQPHIADRERTWN